MHVLVVGGAGYIGSHVVLDLIQFGHQVTVLDNLSTGREENLFPEAAFIRADILSVEVLRKALTGKGFDAVIHLAALKAAGESMNEPEKYAHHNLTGSLNLISATVEARIPHFLFSSSAAVFGDPQYLPLDEAHPKIPTNYYGFTKLQIEEQLAWFSKLRGLSFAALRYFNAAGYDGEGRVRGLEVDPRNLIPVVMEAAVGQRKDLKLFGEDYPTPDGTCIRDYIHVSDLARAHTLACEYLAREKRDLVVNLGTETGHSVKEVVAAAAAIIGRPIPTQIVARRPGDPPNLVASASKARELLGWKPRFSDLPHMLQTTWSLYRDIYGDPSA